MADVRLCGAEELPDEGQVREFSAGGRAVCVARVDGQISAMDNVCPHRGGPLGEGWVEEGKVLCPWHAWTFDPRTGSVNGSATESIAVYPVRIEGGNVLAEMPDA